MTKYTYNQTIEYIDGTRDLNFEAAQKWAREHGTSFEEDVSKREPYEQEHQEEWIAPTGETETRVVKTASLKRFFVIGDEPAPIIIPEPREPTVEELQMQKRSERDGLLQGAQNRIDRYRNQLELGVETVDTEVIYKKMLEYTQYLRDYPSGEDWWLNSPLMFEEWKSLQTTNNNDVSLE